MSLQKTPFHITEEELLKKKQAQVKAREAYNSTAKQAKKLLELEQFIDYKKQYIEVEKKQIKFLRDLATKEPDNDKFSNVARAVLARLDVLGSLIDYVEYDAKRQVI